MNPYQIGTVNQHIYIQCVINSDSFIALFKLHFFIAVLKPKARNAEIKMMVFIYT